MPPGRPSPRPIVAASLVVAMALRILPLPEPWFLVNPDWIALCLIYWMLAIPERVGVGTAWVTGLFADVLTGRLLGQHALAYAVISFLTLRSYRRLRLHPLPQQSFWILVFLLTSQLLVFWTQSVRDADTRTWNYWLPSFGGALVWPGVRMVLGRLRRACGIV